MLRKRLVCVERAAEIALAATVEEEYISSSEEAVDCIEAPQNQERGYAAKVRNRSAIDRQKLAGSRLAKELLTMDVARLDKMKSSTWPRERQPPRKEENKSLRGDGTLAMA